MKWPTLPTGPEKPSWAGLFGTVGLVYVFWDPYRLGAAWPEWLWTGVAFAVFTALNVFALIYWSRRRVMLRVCIAMAIVAVAFTAYRPNGVIFFIIVAGAAPLAVGGHLTRSAAVITGVVLLLLAEWWLLWPHSAVPYIVAAESFLIGGAVTFAVRQQKSLRLALKTAERERIARDLHDILGHTLSVIALKAELASRLLEQNPARAKAEIEDVARVTRGALSEVREAIAGYRGDDLAAEVERAKATLETAGIAVERRYDAVALPVAHERVLALVLREAITNVLRHAQATRCCVTLERKDDVCHLIVSDDGRGGAHREGSGMRGIRERVAAIGGTAAWSTGSGTELTVAVPISTPSLGAVE